MPHIQPKRFHQTLSATPSRGNLPILQMGKLKSKEN